MKVTMIEKLTTNNGTLKKELEKFAKADSNPNLRTKTVIDVYITVINKFRKQKRPTNKLVERLIKILEDNPDFTP